MSLTYGTPPDAMDLNLPKAPQACLSCRKQKRKCNKDLPACSLCERMGRHCDYSEASPAPTSEDFMALRQKLIELEGRLNGNNGSALMDSSPYMPTPSASSLAGNSESANQTPATIYIQGDASYNNIQNRFPAIAFLDSEAFKYGQVAVVKPQVEIPLDVLQILGDSTAVQVVISDYFETIHTWMPIVSKKRLTRNMLNPLWEAGPDLALLFLCMKLIITRPQEGLESPQNPNYIAAKRFLALLEASGMVSLMVLQAYLLVAIYEIGQAIYPAAWMTAGTCVRYGLLLGINGHEKAAQLLGLSNTWTEMEERKRCWWGVIIVDRIVSNGSQGRFLACEDPQASISLPVDTIAWDEGEMTSSGIPSSINSFTESVTPFARLCQASNLNGKVLRHHLERHSKRSPSVYTEASNLYLSVLTLTRQITSTASSSPSSYLLLTAPMAMCFTALCVLCDPYACMEHDTQGMTTPNQEESNMQLQAIEGLKTVAASIKDFCDEISSRTPTSLDIDKISPFVFDAMYAGAANFAWLVRESGDEECQQSLESIRLCLRRLGGRWRAASEYLRILEAQEFTYAVGSGGS